ncbi:hypothetical protein FISHEDRAFT_71064 [Fistulina hepatica ATCC 64428]|nr:hypothetical protein FISHEDRAFT_71064 [Fistulina hepatica ATCC 64428]
MSVPVVSTTIGSFVVETFLYGGFFVLSATSTALLCMRQINIHKQNVPAWIKFNLTTLLRNPMFVGSVLISVFVTGHWILNVISLFQAFVTYDGGHNPYGYYSQICFPTNVLRNAAMSFNIVACDSMIIYRLWIVWSYSKAIAAFPTILIIATFGSGIAFTYETGQCHYQLEGMQPFATYIVTKNTQHEYILYMYGAVLSVVEHGLSYFCIVLIAYRIWTVSSVPRFMGTVNLRHTVAIFVESAALCSIWLVMLGAVYWSKSNMEVVFSNSLPVVMGIAFMLINVRVGLGWAQRATTDMCPPISAFVARAVRNNSVTLGASGESHEMAIQTVVSYKSDTHAVGAKPVQVTISQAADKRREGGSSDDDDVNSYVKAEAYAPV